MDKLILTGATKNPMACDSPNKRQVKKTGDSGLSVLAVGEIPHWRSSGHYLPWHFHMKFVDFKDIDRRLIASLKPDMVLSCLVCEAFDCLDLAHALCKAGFVGRYRVVMPALPRPDIVLAEARSQCPQLEIDYIFEQTGAPERLN